MYLENSGKNYSCLVSEVCGVISFSRVLSEVFAFLGVLELVGDSIFESISMILISQSESG